MSWPYSLFLIKLFNFSHLQRILGNIYVLRTCLKIYTSHTIAYLDLKIQQGMSLLLYNVHNSLHMLWWTLCSQWNVHKMSVMLDSHLVSSPPNMKKDNEFPGSIRKLSTETRASTVCLQHYFWTLSERSSKRVFVIINVRPAVGWAGGRNTLISGAEH